MHCKPSHLFTSRLPEFSIFCETSLALSSLKQHEKLRSSFNSVNFIKFFLFIHVFNYIPSKIKSFNLTHPLPLTSDARLNSIYSRKRRYAVSALAYFKHYANFSKTAGKIQVFVEIMYRKKLR